MPGMNALRLGRYNRASVVRGLADLDVERDLAEKWNAAQVGFMSCAAVAEYGRDMVAGRAAKARHVFDRAEQRHVHLLEHRDAAPRIDQRDVLRSGNDHRAGKRRLL